MFLGTIKGALPSTSIIDVDYSVKGSVEKSLMIASYYTSGK